MEPKPRLVRRSDGRSKPAIERKRSRADQVRRYIAGLAYNPRDDGSDPAALAASLGRVISFAWLVEQSRDTHTAPALGAALVFRLGRHKRLGRLERERSEMTYRLLLYAELGMLQGRTGSATLAADDPLHGASDVERKLVGAWGARLKQRQKKG